MTVLGSMAGISRRVTRRRVMVMADQAASSLSNVVIAILVARSFDAPEPFGAFSLAMISYQLVLGVVRSLVGEALLSLYSTARPSVRRGLVPDLLGATLSVALLASLVLWALSVAFGGLSGAALAGLAVVLPFVLLQDTWRFVFVVDRPASALAVDVVWLGAVIVVLSLAPSQAGVAWYVVVWGIGAALGVVLGFFLHGGPFTLWHPWRWLVAHRAITTRFLGETFTARVLFQLQMSGLGAIAGLGALGAVRAAQLFYGPLNTLNAGVYLAVVPEGAAVRHEPERLRRKLAIVCTGLAAVGAAWMGVGLLLPDRWGQELFGATWQDADSLMLPMGLVTIVAALMLGGLLGLRSLADAKRSLSARLKATPWLAVCPLVGAALGGAGGFTVGAAIGTAVAAVIWWGTFEAALEDPQGAADVQLTQPQRAL